MSAPIPPSSFVVVTKMVILFLSNVGKSIPVIFGCMAVSVFFALTFPDERIRYYSTAAGIFFVIYMIVLRHIEAARINHAIRYLRHTTKDERLVLCRYLKEERSVCNFSVFDGPSASLIGNGILIRATTTFPASDAPVAIQPYIMVHLRKHPELIGLTQADIGSTPMSDTSHKRLPTITLETYE